MYHLLWLLVHLYGIALSTTVITSLSELVLSFAYSHDLYISSFFSFSSVKDKSIAEDDRRKMSWSVNDSTVFLQADKKLERLCEWKELIQRDEKCHGALLDIIYICI